MTKNDAFAQRMVGFALDRGWNPSEEDLAPFMERIIKDLEKSSAFGQQCYQDRCENAYVEQSVMQKAVAEAARRCAELVKAGAKIQRSHAAKCKSENRWTKKEMSVSESGTEAYLTAANALDFWEYQIRQEFKLSPDSSVVGGGKEDGPNGMGMPLRAAVDDGHLSIAIGTHTLTFAFEHGGNNNPFDEASGDFKQRFRIGDPLRFAKDVCHQMNDEAEDGSTPLTRFLDSMMDEAVEQGSLGILDPEDTADSAVSEHS